MQFNIFLNNQQFFHLISFEVRLEFLIEDCLSFAAKINNYAQGFHWTGANVLLG